MLMFTQAAAARPQHAAQAVALLQLAQLGAQARRVGKALARHRLLHGHVRLLRALQRVVHVPKVLRRARCSARGETGYRL